MVHAYRLCAQAAWNGRTCAVPGGVLLILVLALAHGVPDNALGSPAHQGSSEPGYALNFADTASVELAGESTMPLQKDFTLEVWARWFSRATGEQYLVGDEVWHGMSPEIIARQESGCVLRLTEPRRGLRALDFTLGSNRGWFRVYGKLYRDADTWVHAAVVKTKDGIWLFRDGKADGYQKCTGLQFIPSPTPLYLGVRKHAHTNRKFFGDIRAFRLSSSARYQKPFTPPQTFEKDEATLILLDFSAGKGERAPDLSGNGHDGILAGAKWVDLSKEARR
jgi:hypothetical protein